MNEVTLIQLNAALRQIGIAAGGWAIGRGYLDTDTATAIGTILLVVVPFVWGQIKTRRLAKTGPVQ